MSREVTPDAPSVEEFLATDFARLPAPVMSGLRELAGKRLLLTGATGFFGKSLLSLFAFLFRDGLRFDIVAVSRDPQAFQRAHPGFCRAPWLSWVAHDLERPLDHESRLDYVLHAATDTHASNHHDKLRVFDTVLQGSRAVLEAACRCGAARLLLCGSGAQYGAIPSSPSGIDEDAGLGCDPSRSSSAYGEAKRASETLAAAYADKYPLAVVNTRCFAFVGPGLDLGGHFAIGNFLRQAVAGETIRLSSSGTAVRSYLYSADLAVWLLSLMLHAPGGTTVNVGSGQATSVADLAQRVRMLVNPRIDLVLGEDAGGSERSYYLPSVSRAQRLGLDAWTSLDLAITRTAQWCRAGALA